MRLVVSSSAILDCNFDCHKLLVLESVEFHYAARQGADYGSATIENGRAFELNSVQSLYLSWRSSPKASPIKASRAAAMTRSTLAVDRGAFPMMQPESWPQMTVRYRRAR